MFDDAANAFCVFIATTLIATIGVAVGAAASSPVIMFGAGAIMIAAAAAATITGMTSLVGR